MWRIKMHEYCKLKSRIKDILIERGYKEVKPDTYIDYYGSMHSIYASGNYRFMIQWDGEEGFGSVEYWEHDSWKLLEPIVPEGFKEAFDSNLEALCISVQRHL